MVKEYFSDLKWSPHDWEKKDPTLLQESILEFLLERSGLMELTACPRRTWLKLGSLIFANDSASEFADRDLMRTIKRLEPYFKEKVTNHRREGHPHDRRTYHHYFYDLSPEIRAMLKDSLLIWRSTDPTAFQGFEDPAFFRPDGRILARVFSHECRIHFYIDSNDKVELDKRGVTVCDVD